MPKTRHQRFMDKVHKTDGCWLWLGATSGSGYGQFWNGTKNIPAHWFLVVDFMPDGKEACHKCDNKLCVRPDHIFIGTRSENERDKVSKGRHNTKTGCAAMLKVRHINRGINNHECKLTQDQAMMAKHCPRTRGSATAMAKAFRVSLPVICDIRDGKRWCHLKTDPTAAQRAEAFLRTLNLWKES